MLHNIGFFLKYIWKLNKRYFFISAAYIAATAAEPFVFVLLPKMMIDSIVNGQPFREAASILGILLGISLFLKLSQNWLNATLTKEYNALCFKLNSDLGAKVMSLQFQSIEDPTVLDLFNRVKTTLNMNDFFESLSSIASNALSLVGLIAIISGLGFVVFPLIAVVVGVSVLCDARTKKYDYAWQKESAPYHRRFDYVTQLMYGFQFGKEIRINSLKRYVERKYRESIWPYSEKLNLVINKFRFLNMIRSLSGSFQNLALYAYLVRKAILGQITIGGFTMHITAISNFSGALTNITRSMIDINQQSKFIKDFKDFMRMEEMSDSGTIPLKDALKNGRFKISFKNVSFRYPNSSEDALKNVSIDIAKGEKLFIAGVNGAGKTTFIKLLLRLYNPTKGEILVNGVNVKDIRHDEYIKLFGVVFQDFQLFAFSVADNIVLDCGYDQTKLDKAIDASGLGHRINSLPEKEKTEVFKIFSNEGMEFSGGESQKLAIARALYRDSSFAVLDEPLSALDPLAEYEIYSKFGEMAKEKTAIFISHRLACSKLCDSIAVFKDGEIVQYGKHIDLVKKEGLYKEMHDKQTEYYSEERANEGGGAD
jgi:ABC-type multidrug transport system fused ATPase/permease subunit